MMIFSQVSKCSIHLGVATLGLLRGTNSIFYIAGISVTVKAAGAEESSTSPNTSRKRIQNPWSSHPSPRESKRWMAEAGGLQGLAFFLPIGMVCIGMARYQGRLSAGASLSK